MNHCACHPRRGRKTAGAVSALLSGIALVLMPKCPVCLAAYVALITGVGISTTAAVHLQTGLWALCNGVLGVFLWQSARLIWGARMSAQGNRRESSQD